MQYYATILFLASLIASGALALVNFRLRRQLSRAKARAFDHEDSFRSDHSALEALRAELETTERYYDVLFNNARDMIMFYSVTKDGLPGKFTRVNDVACAVLEHQREKLLGMTPLEIEAGEKTGTIRLYSRSELVMLSEADLRYRESTSERQLIQHIMNSAEAQYERVFVSRTGRRIPVEITARRLDMAGRELIVMIAHDVTNRKMSERALREGRNGCATCSPIPRGAWPSTTPIWRWLT